MKGCTFLACLAMLLLAAANSAAQDKSPKPGGIPCPSGCCAWPEALLRACPDTYCSKPFPCIRCLPACGLPDTYCRKPLPCPPSTCGCWLPDDYCPKPFPCLRRPLCAEFYRCGPCDTPAAAK